MESTGLEPHPYLCTTHAEAPAAWRCVGCERQLCEHCAAPAEGHSRTAFCFCAHCGAGTVQLTVPGVEQSFRQLLVLTWRLPIGARTAGLLLAVLVGGALLASDARQGGLAWGALLLVMTLVLASGTAIILQASAQGMDSLRPEADNLGQPLVDPALRMWPATAFLFALPQLSEYAPTWRSGPTLQDALIFLAGGVLGPWLSLGLVLGRPLDIARRLPRLGADAGWVAGLTGLATLLCWHFVAAALYVQRMDPELASFSALMHAFSLLTLLWLARVYGTLLHVHAPALEHPLPARFQVPVAPRATPRGTPYRPPEPAPREVEPLELDVAPEAPPPLEAIRQALEARDARGALAAFARLEARQHGFLSTETYVQLGRAAASLGEWARAREAFTLGTRVQPRHPATATACVLLARLLEERLGEPNAAEAFYRHVVTYYPDTDAARFARSRLEAGAT